jgi:hypothetical protein
VATNAILGEAAELCRSSKEDIFAQIGCCKHWIKPHSMWWTAGGGFAWPMGYDKTTTGYSYSALPELEWSIVFKWIDGAWQIGRTGARCLVFRIAIPTRTARHMQAAIHTIWTPRSPLSTEKVVQLYGFRKLEGAWQLTDTEVLRPQRK